MRTARVMAFLEKLNYARWERTRNGTTMGAQTSKTPRHKSLYSMHIESDTYIKLKKDNFRCPLLHVCHSRSEWYIELYLLYCDRVGIFSVCLLATHGNKVLFIYTWLFTMPSVIEATHIYALDSERQFFCSRKNVCNNVYYNAKEMLSKLWSFLFHVFNE